MPPQAILHDAAVADPPQPAVLHGAKSHQDALEIIAAGSIHRLIGTWMFGRHCRCVLMAVSWDVVQSIWQNQVQMHDHLYISYQCCDTRYIQFITIQYHMHEMYYHGLSNGYILYTPAGFGVSPNFWTSTQVSTQVLSTTANTETHNLPSCSLKCHFHLSLYVAHLGFPHRFPWQLNHPLSWRRCSNCWYNVGSWPARTASRTW